MEPGPTFYQFTGSRPEADESCKYVSEVRVSGKAPVMQKPPAPLKPAEGAGWTSTDTWYAEPPLGENPFDDWQELDPSRYFLSQKPLPLAFEEIREEALNRQ